MEIKELKRILTKTMDRDYTNKIFAYYDLGTGFVTDFKLLMEELNIKFSIIDCRFLDSDNIVIKENTDEKLIHNAIEKLVDNSKKDKPIIILGTHIGHSLDKLLSGF